MKAFARITSVVFVALGLLVILAGIVVALSGFFGEQPSVSTPGLMPDISGLVILMRIFGGAAISLQGFFLAAIGQGIWLLVDIAKNTEASSTYFTALMRKNAARG
jgi:hypothetical protein